MDSRGVAVVNYAFVKASKTITFTDYTSSIELRRILAVYNVTRNVVLFNPSDPLKGGTVAANVLTLTFDTTGAGFANGDVLAIYYEPAVGNYGVITPDNTAHLTQPINSISVLTTAGNIKYMDAAGVDQIKYGLQGQEISTPNCVLVYATGTTAVGLYGQI